MRQAKGGACQQTCVASPFECANLLPLNPATEAFTLDRSGTLICSTPRFVCHAMRRHCGSYAPCDEAPPWRLCAVQRGAPAVVSTKLEAPDENAALSSSDITDARRGRIAISPTQRLALSTLLPPPTPLPTPLAPVSLAPPSVVGDPPNIIIGTALEKHIGFVDFIINLAPGNHRMSAGLLTVSPR